MQDTFSRAVEAARLTLGFTLFPTQVACAEALLEGRIVEMQTGEGKTLAAMPAAAVLAQDGQGVHVLTANDYLAQRDAEWMAPAYAHLGLRVAWVRQTSTAEERRAAYAADITYIAATEAGFDHLRDCRALTRAERVQRGLHAALIDEADSILIDEARIPLVLAGETEGAVERARAAARAVVRLQPHLHFTLNTVQPDVQLTDAGLQEIERLLGNVYEDMPLLTAVYHAIHARYLLSRDTDYLVSDGRVVPIDEYKGRMAQERRWPAGIHAALEEKEGLEIRDPGRVLSSITLQNYVLQYDHLCGMTGTAATQAVEFERMYTLDTVVLPTHRPMIRSDFPDRLYSTRAQKLAAIVEEVRTAHATGRPVLVGTDSVEASEQLSALLPDVPHQVLNARHEATEAALIAQAGQRGTVTVSTNMAGRGVDILLGPGVAEMGGLHVVGTCRHASRRIDYQLRGRAGRQGDPGSSRFFVSLEDDLVRRFRDDDEQIRTVDDISMLQRRAEGQHLDARIFLDKYERVLEGQRHAVLAAREELLDVPEQIGRLAAIDEAWACFLEEVAELKTGFAWLNLGGRDPLSEYLRTVDKLFTSLWDQVELEADTEVPVRRGATWTYLTTDQPFGTGLERIMKGLARKAKSRSLWG
jgi:preprotein translocase subunit SecA